MCKKKNNNNNIVYLFDINRYILSNHVRILFIVSCIIEKKKFIFHSYLKTKIEEIPFAKNINKSIKISELLSLLYRKKKKTIYFNLYVFTLRSCQNIVFILM